MDTAWWPSDHHDRFSQNSQGRVAHRDRTLSGQDHPSGSSAIAPFVGCPAGLVICPAASSHAGVLAGRAPSSEKFACAALPMQPPFSKKQGRSCAHPARPFALVGSSAARVPCLGTRWARHLISVITTKLAFSDEQDAVGSLTPSNARTRRTPHTSIIMLVVPSAV
jgi:hypothetical protein